MPYSAAAFAIAFLLALAGTALLRRRLGDFVSREAKPGKEKIHRLFPRPRKPLAGGVSMMIALAVGTLVAARMRGDPARQVEAMLTIVAAAWLFAAIGMTDDLRKARGSGLAERAKLAAQAVVAIGVGLYLKLRLVDGDVYLPVAGYLVNPGWLYVPWAAMVIIATANAVNLTDGVDGLAAGSMAIAGLAYFAIGLAGSSVVQLTAPALFGACLGFLVFNYPPARVIMGDTGALGLGAALAMMALLSLSEWALVLVGGVAVIDALSVILQTGAIKIMRGPLQLLRHRTSEPWRPFLCTPLHHHFQWLGWREPRILALLWGTGAVLGLLGVADYVLRLGWPWLTGLALMAAFLAAAAWHKMVRANFFLGLMPSEDGEELLALFRGIPVRVVGRALYRPWKLTPIPASALGPVAAENLWRPLGEVEAAVVLGKVYCEHKLYDQALAEWEQVPARNLVSARPEVALRLARIYYARNRILDAVRLWEMLPGGAGGSESELGRAVASAKARLADLAGKSYRQAMRSREPAELAQARALNEDLLELLVYQREKLEAPGPDMLGPGERERGLFRRMERAVLQRIADLDERLDGARPPRPTAGGQASGAIMVGAHGCAPVPGGGARAPSTPPDSRTENVARRLGLTAPQFAQAFASCPYGVPGVRWCEAVPGASRNEIYRLDAQWAGPETIIAKCYDPSRIQFFSACYRRETEVVRLLHEYGCKVPELYGGAADEHRAVAFFEDLGPTTLSQRLREVGRDVGAHGPFGYAQGRRAPLLESAVEAVAHLHAAARRHLPRLREEILRIDKEALSERYYMDAFSVALGRLLTLVRAQLSPDEWRVVRGQLAEIAATLATQPKTFIHFELTPHHLALRGERDALLFIAFDFEQATIGPPEFDLVTLLRSPEVGAALRGRPYEPELERLAQCYRRLMAEHVGADSCPPLPPSAPTAADYAALFKGLVYAGAAANFARRFVPTSSGWLARLRWYLDDWRAVALRYPGLADTADIICSHLRPILEPERATESNSTEE